MLFNERGVQKELVVVTSACSGFFPLHLKTEFNLHQVSRELMKVVTTVLYNRLIKYKLLVVFNLNYSISLGTNKKKPYCNPNSKAFKHITTDVTTVPNKWIKLSDHVQDIFSNFSFL